MGSNENNWRTQIIDRLRDRNRKEADNFQDLIECSEYSYIFKDS